MDHPLPKLLDLVDLSDDVVHFDHDDRSRKVKNKTYTVLLSDVGGPDQAEN
jgi:hypothetical protein